MKQLFNQYSKNNSSLKLLSLDDLKIVYFQMINISMVFESTYTT